MRCDALCRSFLIRSDAVTAFFSLTRKLRAMVGLTGVDGSAIGYKGQRGAANMQDSGSHWTACHLWAGLGDRCKGRRSFNVPSDVWKSDVDINDNDEGK